MKLSNQTYDVLKKVALTIAPIATFVGAVCVIWGIPFAEQITATLAAFDSLLGTLLGISTKHYRADKEQDTYNEDGEEMYEVVEDEDQDGMPEEE